MRRVFLATSCILWGLSATTRAGDWPNWRGPQHNGISSESGWQAEWPDEGPKRLWTAKVGTGFASVVVSQGRLFTLGNEDNHDVVVCLDAHTGERVWEFRYTERRAPKYYEGGPSATPTVDGNRVYIFSKSGVAHCFDVANGDVIWAKALADDLNLKKPTWGFAGSPLIQANIVILNAGDAGVALDKRTGSVAWSSGEGPSGYATPVPFEQEDQRLLALMTEQAFVAVQVENGEVFWRLPWKTRHDVNAPDPVLVDAGRFFITSGYGHGCALVEILNNQPKVVWENGNMRSLFVSPVLWDGHLYGVDDKRFVCLELTRGELMWEERSVGRASVLVADGKLIVLGEKGELHVARPSAEKFDVISRAQVLGGKCWTVPVLANGRIYCRNSKGDLVSLDVNGD